MLDIKDILFEYKFSDVLPAFKASDVSPALEELPAFKVVLPTFNL